MLKAYSETTHSNMDEDLGNLILSQDQIGLHLEKSSEDISTFNRLIKEITATYEEIKQNKINIDNESSQFISTIFSFIDKISGNMKQIQEAMNQDIKRICSDFFDLSKITKLSDAYEESIEEISRRSTQTVT